MAKKESVKKSTGKKLTISNDSDNFVKIESENENAQNEGEVITEAKEATVVTPENMEEVAKNELNNALAESGILENYAEIANSMGIIDEINQSKEHINNLLETNSEELESTLKSELEKTNGLEEKVKEKIGEYEKKLTNGQKKLFDTKFSNYWNGWSSEF